MHQNLWCQWVSKTKIWNLGRAALSSVHLGNCCEILIRQLPARRRDLQLMIFWSSLLGVKHTTMPLRPAERVHEGQFIGERGDVGRRSERRKNSLDWSHSCSACFAFQPQKLSGILKTDNSTQLMQPFQIYLLMLVFLIGLPITNYKWLIWPPRHSKRNGNDFCWSCQIWRSDIRTKRLLRGFLYQQSIYFSFLSEKPCWLLMCYNVINCDPWFISQISHPVPNCTNWCQIQPNRAVLLNLTAVVKSSDWRQAAEYFL